MYWKQLERHGVNSMLNTLTKFHCTWSILLRS